MNAKCGLEGSGDRVDGSNLEESEGRIIIFVKKRKIVAGKKKKDPKLYEE